MILEEFLNILHWFLFSTTDADSGCDRNEAERKHLHDDPANIGNDEDGRGQNEGDIEADVVLNRGQVANDVSTKAIWNNTIWPSIKWNIATLAFGIVIAAVGALLLYVDFEMTDKCLSLLQFNGTVLSSAQRWELLGESGQTLIVNFWFVATMMLLFDEPLTQSLKFKLLYVALVFSSFQIVVTAHLIVFDVYNRSIKEVFLFGVLYSSYLVAKAQDETRTSAAKGRIAISIGAQFILMFIVGLCHRVFVIPKFSSEENPNMKVFIALIAPAFSFFATSLSQFFVLAWSTTWLVRQKRMYVLVYFNQLLPLALFRVMQADFDNWGWFVGLSFIYSVTTFFSEATCEQRKAFWLNTMEYLSKHWPRLETRPQPLFEKPASKRLQIDLQIQHLLYNYTLIVLSQVYITLYRYSTFDIPLQDEISRMAGRFVAALAIELFLNVLSLSLQIRFCGKRITSEEKRNYIYHGTANVVVVMVTICYFSQVIFNVLKVPTGAAATNFRVRNCSSPFTYQ